MVTSVLILHCPNRLSNMTNRKMSDPTPDNDHRHKDEGVS